MSLKQSLTIALIACFLTSGISFTGFSQQNGTKEFQYLESVLDENYAFLKKINRIIKEYPDFSYEYEIIDGEVKNVTVKGVDYELDKKRLEVLLLDLKSNRNEIKNKESRIGVFYAPDQQARFKNGQEELQRKLLGSLEYPEGAENWGVEGTIFVKMVVDENGEIPYATTSSDVNTSIESYITDLENKVIEAVKLTSGQWIPGKVDGVAVPSFVTLPVTFKLETHPTLPAPIY
jgi:hypothetical protein